MLDGFKLMGWCINICSSHFVFYESFAINIDEEVNTSYAWHVILFIGTQKNQSV